LGTGEFNGGIPDFGRNRQAQCQPFALDEIIAVGEAIRIELVADV